MRSGVTFESILGHFGVGLAGATFESLLGHFNCFWASVELEHADFTNMGGGGQNVPR